MFETIESKPNRIVLYFAQLFGVPVATGIVSVPVFAMYDPLTRSLPGASAGVWDVAGLLVLFGIGIALGCLAGRRWGTLTPAGFWVWVPVASVSITDFLLDWFSPYEHAEAFSMSFRSVGGHEGLIRFIETNPAFSLIGYSLGLYFARRRGWKRAAPRSTSPLQADLS